MVSSKKHSFHIYLRHHFHILYIYVQDINELPKNLAYSLRFPDKLRTTHFWIGSRSPNWQTDLLFQSDGFRMKHPDKSDGGQPSYREEGFLTIQNTIAKTFMAKNNPSIAMPEIQMQRFPTPAHTRNTLLATTAWILPWFFLLSLNYTFMNTVRFMTIEKEKQLKEAMRIMGLANWMHYLSWFIRSIIMLAITMLLITVLITVTILFLYLSIDWPK